MNLKEAKQTFESTKNLIVTEEYAIRTIELMIAGRLAIGDKSSDIYLYLQSQLTTAKNNLQMLNEIKEGIQNTYVF